PGKWLVWRIGNPIGNIGLNPSPIEFKTPKCNEPRKTGVRQQSGTAFRAVLLIHTIGYADQSA
ncbi:hypothetical protein DYI41_13940, partial [Marinobacter salarius]|nr:hypothetical protein [Marinobacter salarius]